MAQLRGIDGEWQQADIAAYAGVMAEGRTARRLAAKETRVEILAFWRMLEQVEEAYRSNAKVMQTIVWTLPHGLSAEDRWLMVNAFCARAFGSYGLPWVAAIHEPDAAGDHRNHHAHIASPPGRSSGSVQASGSLHRRRRPRSPTRAA